MMIWLLVFLGCWLVGGTVVQAQVKAFPTAEGYGANSIGGRGGTVFIVNNLNDSGAGSLRACVEATIPRTCVFRVSGTINLTSGRITTNSPYLTIAGQTSPRGIQVRGPTTGANQNETGIMIHNSGGHPHDIIIRYIRMRSGVYDLNSNEGKGILLYGQDTTQNQIYNVIVDHSSFQWQGDTQLDATSNVTDITFQWNILSNASNEGVNQSIGGIGGTQHIRISVHHNLYALSQQRNPLAYGTNPMDFRNNLIYSWNGNNSANFGTWHNWYNTGHAYLGNIINNIWLAGPHGSTPTMMIDLSGPNRVGDGIAADLGGTKIYTEGNIGPGGCGTTTDMWTTALPYHCLGTWEVCDYNASPLGSGGGCDVSVRVVNQNTRTFTPFSVPAITTHATNQLQAALFAAGGVGASRNAQGLFRDSVDTQVINDVINGTGFMCFQDFCSGPWPDLATGAPAAPADNDNDGIPNTYETGVLQSNPNDVTDGAQCPTGTLPNCYTRLEIYLNDLAGDGGGPGPGPNPTGNDIYMANGGSDATAGVQGCLDAENPATPFATYARACQCLTVAGKRLRVRGGTYPETIDTATCPITGGTAGLYTRIEGYPGETAIFQLPGGQENVVWLQAASDSYIEVKNLTLDAMDRANSSGIRFGSAANHIRVTGNTIRNGLFEGVVAHVAGTADIEVVGNTVQDFGRRGITSDGSMSNWTIDQNHVHTIGWEGISTNHSTGMATGLRITRNRVRTTGGAATNNAVQVGASTNALIANNLIYDNDAGMTLLANANGAKVYHNTVASNTGVGLQCTSPATTVAFTNNISFGNGTNPIGNACGATLTTNMVTDPLFANLGADDYTLQATSPALDAGTLVPEVPIAFNGVARPVGPQVDIGAYEQAASVTGGSMGPLIIHTGNPRYFQKPSGDLVYLTGGYHWNFFSPFMGLSEATAYLDQWVATGQNLIRAANWDPTFDTPATNPPFDAAYFSYIASRVALAQSKGIYVMVTIFQHLNQAPFTSLAYCESYAQHMVDILGTYDNVLFEVGNELVTGPLDGGTVGFFTDRIVDVVKARQASASLLPVPVGISDYHPGATQNFTANPAVISAMLSSSADFMIPGWSEIGTAQGTVLPIDRAGAKVTFVDSDHIFPYQLNHVWVWRGFMRGHNMLVLAGNEWHSDHCEDDAGAPCPLTFDAVMRMGDPRAYTLRMNMAQTAPNNGVSSTGYALANPGVAYLVYQPGTGAFTVTLPANTYTVEWFNAATQVPTNAGTIVASGPTNFTPPFADDAVLYLTVAEPPVQPALTAAQQATFFLKRN